MRNQNSYNCTGRMGQDPKRISDTMVTFSLAVQDVYYSQKKAELVKQTHWIPCVVTGPVCAPVLKYTHKGSLVAVTGSIEQRSWNDESGNKRSRLQFKVKEIQFLQSAEESTPVEVDEDEDIPF